MTANTGLGISSTAGTFRWNGHSFNPSCDPAVQSWNPWTQSWAGFSVFATTSSFDLTGFRYGNEAIASAVQFSSNVADYGTVVMNWYDPGVNLIFSTSVAFSMPAGGWYACWSGIGVKADGLEIWENGTYTIHYVATGQHGSLSGFLSPVVSNYPAATYAYGSVGDIWVEGEELAFINYQDYKTLCHNDGVAYDVAGLPDASLAGHIWLETNGKISYISETGYKRCTKMGDKYGNYPDPSELPGAPGTAYSGHIWVSSAFYTDSYLCFISNDGIKYRLGVGYVDAVGDYQ